MGVKSFIKKSVAFVSALAMACSMVVMPAGASYAAEADSGLNLNKSVELQSDGTYKITLTSYATGEYTTVTEKSGVPLDIVLVLDQSGSMDEKVNGVKKIDSLKSAVNSFVKNISDNAKEYNVDHRIALVGYASNKSDGKSSSGIVSSGSSSNYWVNTGLFINGKLKNYAGNSNTTSLTSQNYKDSLVNVNTTDGDITSSITTAINNIAASGATRTQIGMEMANGVFSNNPIESGSDRKRIVVVFTDGEPGKSGYDESVAGSAVNEAYKTKNTYGATVYSVGFYDSASTNVTNFMNYISSNYPGAEYKDVEKQHWWGGTYTETEFVPGDKTDTKYYMKATSQTELNNIFTNISKDIENPSTSVKLDANAVTRDIITDKLDISDKAQVTAYTEDYKGSDTWKKSANQVALTTSINKDTKTVDVTGFDYAANFVDKTKAKGQRLVVEITGLTATQAGDSMITNVTDKSGVYATKDTENPSEIFNECSISIPSKSYVLDYGKTVSTAAADYGVNAVTIANTGKPSPYSIDLTGDYGTFAIFNGALNYTPGKINWDGIDTGYVFGEKDAKTIAAETEAEKSGKDYSAYKWEEVNFIPASSVYYEDDFGTSDNGDSEISIVWSGKDWSKAPDSNSVSTTDKNQSSKNEVYGWDDSYKDNLGYSDGSATMTNTKGATATFTFTGTGVDVYSRTNGAVGLIRAAVYSGVGATNEDGTKKETVQSQYIDNVSTSGDYYQIPTLSFENLDYGTYTVVITAGAQGKGTAGTYYLDGIRVYNPLKGNDTAEAAYDKAGESNAQYIKLRDTLLANGFGTTDESTPGSVFIDRMNGENGVTVGTKDDYNKYGPKNEVYLAKDQAVAFEIDGYANAEVKPNVFIGLKALNQATTATITNGSGKVTENINSSSDLYYQITPTSSGRVVIKNNSDNILAITKVRITKASSQAKLMATPALLSYTADFDSLSETETPVVDEDNKDDEDTNLDKDDVEIENPSDITDNDKQETINSIWNSILSSIKNWFKR